MNDCEAGASGASMAPFDVFLNHRGPDVKATFVAHLEDALRCAGFRPFLDARSLMKGDPALKSIDQALDMAKVHVAVVSGGYAGSKYCLNELVAMMRSGKPVVPVFYDVEPVDLRWVENGPFAEAFKKHERKGRSQKKLQEWKDALEKLAGITGFCLSAYKRDEAKLKREVVNEVARLTPSNDPVEVERYRVGLEGSTRRCIEALGSMGGGIGLLGLVGMGGVGKTTLAKEIYNHYVAEKRFKHMTFLEIHRDPSTSNVEVRPTWPRKLRKQLLWDLLRVQTSTSNDYSSWFQKVSSLGPVLIVIDDVHKLGQFEALVPFAGELHPGSRIIVTSRDRSMLNSVAGRTKVDHHVHEVSTLGLEESSMLFCWHAFGTGEAPEEYKALAKDVVEACGGLPLALKVIGSSLFDKKLEEERETIWAEAVQALRQSRDVMGVLRWSYDSLGELEKRMFVDITCLFDGRFVEEALAYWKGCKECPLCGGVPTPHTSLRSLVNKNLVTVPGYDSTVFKVHDLLVGLGKEIGAKGKSHYVSGNISEGRNLKKLGTRKTIAVDLVGSRKRKFEAEDFANMPNLHFLALPHGCIVNGDLGRISSELRWLQWRGMPYECMPMNLDISNLTYLDFSESSKLASLWLESCGNFEGCSNLLKLNLRNCRSITKLPNSIGQSLHLQRLMLDGCSKLKELPESIGQLEALVNLNLRRCINLIGLPNSIGQALRLQELYLDGCKKLKKLPESIGQLKELKNFCIWDCSSLEALPDTMTAVSSFFITGCTSLMKLPTSIRHWSSLETLQIFDLDCTTDLGANIREAWIQLEDLHLRNCSGVESFIQHGAFKTLTSLNLDDDTLIELPESIGLLMHLQHLRIACARIQGLPNSIGDLKMLKELMLVGCNNLKGLPITLGALTSFENLYIFDCWHIRELLKSAVDLPGLRRLEVRFCKNLQKLPTSIRNLRNLERFRLEGCWSIQAMGALTTLQGLPIWGSTSTTQLPASLGFVSTLGVYGYKVKPGERHYREFAGAGQVLEEDESGFLKAYHNELSGVTRLVRGIHEMRNST